MNIAIPPESEGLGAAAAAIPKDAQAAAKPKYRFLPKTHTQTPPLVLMLIKGLPFGYVLFNLL